MDPGGIDVFSSDLNSFRDALLRKIARSSELLPIRALSAASAMHIRMRSCTSSTVAGHADAQVAAGGMAKAVHLDPGHTPALDRPGRAEAESGFPER